MQAAQTTETWRSVSAVKIRGGYRDTGRVGGSNNERKGKGRWGSQLSLEDTRVLLVRSQHGTTETWEEACARDQQDGHGEMRRKRTT